MSNTVQEDYANLLRALGELECARQVFIEAPPDAEALQLLGSLLLDLSEETFLFAERLLAPALPAVHADHDGDTQPNNEAPLKLCPQTAGHIWYSESHDDNEGRPLCIDCGGRGPKKYSEQPAHIEPDCDCFQCFSLPVPPEGHAADCAVRTKAAQ